MLESSFGEAGKVYNEMSSLAFETMIEFVRVEPLSRHPGDPRKAALVLRSCLRPFDNVSHGLLVAKPAEVFVGVGEWVVDNLGKQVDR